MVEALGIGLPFQPPFDDLCTRTWIQWRPHLHHHPEAVEQLWTQLALLLIHRTQQGDPRGMLHREPFALHAVDAHRRDIQQNVNEVVRQKVDLIDVENPAVRRRQQAGLKRLSSILQRPFKIEAAEHTVLTGSQGQIYERYRGRLHGAELTVAHLASGRRLARSAVVGTPNHSLDRWHNACQAPSGSTFRTAFLATNQHPANAWIDRAKKERTLELLLADERSKRKVRNSRYRFRSHAFHAVSPRASRADSVWR